ncbi:MAG: PaaI family thioesterase [Proteobacteria bacterium]|nr:PaaI family thioesterase [Pseudomonadota bacterium]
MKRINQEWVEVIKTIINPCPYFELQTMSLLEIEYGYSKMEIDLKRDHLQPFGIVHGGVFASIIDAAGFWAVFSEADPNVGMTTVELKINYLAPAVDGKLVATGNCIRMGKTLGLGEAKVENESGKLLAHGTTTLMVQPNLNLGDTSGIPEKFISG